MGGRGGHNRLLLLLLLRLMFTYCRPKQMHVLRSRVWGICVLLPAANRTRRAGRTRGRSGSCHLGWFQSVSPGLFEILRHARKILLLVELMPSPDSKDEGADGGTDGTIVQIAAKWLRKVCFSLDLAWVPIKEPFCYDLN